MERKKRKDTQDGNYAQPQKEPDYMQPQEEKIPDTIIRTEQKTGPTITVTGAIKHRINKIKESIKNKKNKIRDVYFSSSFYKTHCNTKTYIRENPKTSTFILFTALLAGGAGEFFIRNYTMGTQPIQESILELKMERLGSKVESVLSELDDVKSKIAEQTSRFCEFDLTLEEIAEGKEYRPPAEKVAKKKPGKAKITKKDYAVNIRDVMGIGNTSLEKYGKIKIGPLAVVISMLEKYSDQSNLKKGHKITLDGNTLKKGMNRLRQKFEIRNAYPAADYDALRYLTIYKSRRNRRKKTRCNFEMGVVPGEYVIPDSKGSKVEFREKVIRGEAVYNFKEKFVSLYPNDIRAIRIIPWGPVKAIMPKFDLHKAMIFNLKGAYIAELAGTRIGETKKGEKGRLSLYMPGKPVLLLHNLETCDIDDMRYKKNDWHKNKSRKDNYYFTKVLKNPTYLPDGLEKPPLSRVLTVIPGL